jgi:type III secretion protein J
MKHSHRQHPFCAFLICCLALLLAGCGEKVLYTGLREKDANEMVSILLSQGIGAEKKPGEENTWVAWVDSNSFANAIAILNESGYPKDKFSSLGEVFKKTGLVSSPLEERIRFMYALSETLAETISHIQGVATARVNIVLPENDPYTDKKLPSSASVFITHLPNANIEDFIREIKNLVASSIEGLQYDKVTVALFPAQLDDTKKFAANKSLFKKALFLDLAPSSVGDFWTLIGSLLLIASILFGAIGFLVWKLHLSSSTSKEPAPPKKPLPSIK